MPELVIDVISNKKYLKRKKHPSKITQKSMESVRKGKTIKAKDFDYICKKIGL